MTTAHRPAIAILTFFLLSLTAGQASARPWRFGGGFRGRIYAPPIHVEVQSYPAYPPPPPPSCCYEAPPPRMVMEEHRPHLDIGLALAGVGHAPSSGQLPVGGVVGALQFRTSGHSLLALELQSLGAHRPSNDTRRSEVAGLVAARIFLWNADLAPYLEVAAGFGRTSIEMSGVELQAADQLIGRYGFGLELRLGRHLVIEGQIARVHKLRASDESRVAYDGLEPASDRTIGEHERATEFRGGVAFRF